MIVAKFLLAWLLLDLLIVALLMTPARGIVLAMFWLFAALVMIFIGVPFLLAAAALRLVSREARV